MVFYVKCFFSWSPFSRGLDYCLGLVLLSSIHFLIFLCYYCLYHLQIRGMHTLIRDAQTTKHDFVFYADRLIRLVGILLIKETTSKFVVRWDSFPIFNSLLNTLHLNQVVEHGLGHLPFTEKQVITPTGESPSLTSSNLSLLCSLRLILLSISLSSYYPFSIWRC